MKRLFIICLAIIFLASCKTVAMQQQYVFRNGKLVREGNPQPFQIQEGAIFYKVYGKNVMKHKN